MADRYFEILRKSGHSGNFIPVGRQLHRTPPLTDVRRHLDFCNEETIGDESGPRQDEAAGDHQDHCDQNSTFDFNSHETKPVRADDPASLLTGMKGYQLTSGDLEFIQKMKEDQRIKKLQGDLEEMERLLKRETMALELTLASREKAQAELSKFPSCEELAEWVKVVLAATSAGSPPGPDAESHLAAVTKADVEKVVEEKRMEIARMEKMVANKRKKEAKERGRLERQVASEQLKIRRLMGELSELKLTLAQEEEIYRELLKQISTREGRSAAGGTSKELKAAKSLVKPRGKERMKIGDGTQPKTKNPDTKNTDGLKDPAHKNTHESRKTSAKEQTKHKSGVEERTKTVKVVRGRRLAEEEEEEESSPPRSSASRSKKRSNLKPKEAETQSGRKAAAGGAAEVEQNAGPRRSKRIASRR